MSEKSGSWIRRIGPSERMHRDPKIQAIVEGTSEIRQLVIAGAIAGMRIE